MTKKKMTDRPSKELELEERLREAEEILDALRSHKVDAVIGADQIAMIRLKEIEDQLQEQIQISSNRLKEIESIYQNVPVGLCILDRDLKFVRVNNYLAKMHGIPAEEHLGKTMSEILPKLAESTEEDLRRVIETGDPQMDVELKCETPAQPGVERYWLEQRFPVYNKQEQIIGINMVVEEVTERKKFEEKLQELNATLEERVAERTMLAEQRADKLRDMARKMIHVEEKERQRLARVLHDGLQQLLIGAKFKTSLIKKRLEDKDQEKEEIEQLNDLLDRSIEASRSLSYELSPPILHDQGLVAALYWLAGRPHLQDLAIHIEAEKDMLPLSQDLKVFFFQAIRELLINIVKHAEVQEAEVCISYDNDEVCIEVIDRGKGFDVENLKLSSPTGQGLRNMREKLELMKGKLKIESVPGMGSHFTLCVPIDKNSTPSVSDKTAENNNHITGGTVSVTNESTSDSSAMIGVLVVDDHQVMRNGLVRLLAEEPDIKIVGEASNGIEAVDFAHDIQPDVIIMDITMPEMDGIEATSLIHQKFPEIHIIGLSMHEESEYSKQMKRAGAVDLLNKGGPANRLLAAIRSVNA